MLLRRQPFDPPRFAVARVTKAIVQAVGATLPKFDSLRFHPITAPVRWTWNFLSGQSLFQLRKPRFQYSSYVEHVALMRNPRPKLAANRPRMKIAGRFFVRNFFSHAVDPDLPLEFLPMNNQTRSRIFFQVPGLFALVIRVKNETSVIVTLEQNHARSRLAIFRHRCQGNCIHLTDPNLYRRGEPNPELLDRVGIEIDPAQTVREVVVAQRARIERDVDRNEKV